MNLNVYKSDLDIAELKEKLNEEEYVEIKSRKFSDQNINLILFIEEKPSKLPDWLDELAVLFKVERFSDEELTKYNGIVVVETSKNIYMVSFGHAFWTIEKYADLDFGMDFAERGIKEDNITLKGISFIQRNKMRGLINYKKGLNEFPQASESYFTLSGIPTFEKEYGKSVDCGVGVKFQKTFNMFPKKSENKFKNINQLVNIFNEIDITMGLRVNSTLPRLQTLKKNDEQSKELDRIFLSKITEKENEEANIYLDLNRIQLIGNSVKVIDNSHNIQIYITSDQKGTQQTLEVDATNIQEYLFKHKDSIDGLDRIKIRILDDNGESLSRTSELRTLMYCELELEGSIYIFQNGTWGYLNNKFLELLNNKMEEINGIVKFEERFNIEYSNPIKKSERGENAYIKDLCSQDKNLIKLHRRNIYLESSPVELADLYCKKNKELIAVKRGMNTDTAIYSFEQSLLSIQLLTNHQAYDTKGQLNKYNDKVEEQSELYEHIPSKEIDTLLKSKNCSVLWLIGEKPKYVFEGVTNSSFKVSEIESLLLRLKILNWYSFVKDLNLTPTLYFGLDKPINAAT